MDFEPDDTQKAILDNARAFLTKEIAPLAAEYDRGKRLDKETARDLIRRLIPLGYVVGPMPEEYGGAGLSWLTYGMMMEELWKAYAALGLVVMIQGAPARMLLEQGSEEQKSRYLPRLLSGDIIGCGAITEPDVGSNAAHVKTTARRDGDDWVIDGTKTWISNGTIADLAVVVATVDRTKGAKGIARFLVELDGPGCRGRNLPKLGCRSAPTSELFFESVRVPGKNMLGRPGEGLKATLKGFEIARSFLACGAMGIAQASIDVALEYATSREQFGQPIARFQLVQQMLAEMKASIDAGRMLAYRGLWKVDRGERADLETSLAKWWCTERAVEVTSKAIQIHGSYGLSEELPVERFFRDARTLTIPDGTSQIQQLIVGRAMTGIGAFA